MVRCLNIQQQQQQQRNSFRYVYTTKGPKNQSIGSLFFAWFVEQGRAGQSRAEQSRARTFKNKSLGGREGGLKG